MQRGKRERDFFSQRTDLCCSSCPRGGGARAGGGKDETGCKFAAAMERQWNLAQVMKAVVKTTIGWMGESFRISFV
jgi:hypothetical protein